MGLDKRDREEVERLIEKAIQNQEDVLNALSRGMRRLSGREEIRPELIRVQDRLEYLQGLLERVRAEYGPPGEAFAPIR